MKKIFIAFIILTTLSGALPGATVNKNEKVPDVSIGINGNFGSFNMYNSNINIDNQPGLYTGGGLSIEKMIYDNFGIGSGIQYRYFNTNFVMDYMGTNYNAKWTFQSVNIPLLMLFSLSGGDSGITIAGGVIYSHIFYSMMTTDTTLPIDTSKDNALKYISTDQVGAAAGIILKFKATEYTDLVFGLMGEFYPTNLLYKGKSSNEKLNMFNYSLTTGWMFRTNIFPGS